MTKAQHQLKYWPQWTRRVEMEGSGRDPLGLSRVSDALTNILVSNLITTTDRARYCSLYTWAITEGLPELDQLVSRALKNRERWVELQQIRLVVIIISGPVTGPGIFSSFLSPTKWSGFARRLRGLENRLRSRLIT